MANKKEGSPVDFEVYNLGALRVPTDEHRRLVITLRQLKQVKQVQLTGNTLRVVFDLGKLQGKTYEMARSVLKSRVDQAIKHKVLQTS